MGSRAVEFPGQNAPPHKTFVLIQELRRYLAHMLLATSILSAIIITGVAVSIGLDVHAIRVNQIQESAEFRSGLFSRLEAFKWNADTLSRDISATNKTVTAALTQARIQERHSREDQTADLKATSTAVAKAAEQTATTQTKALEQIIASKPVVNVETPKPPATPAPTIVVQPAPVAQIHTPIQPARVTRSHGIWRRLRAIWPFGRHDGR